MAQGLEAEGVAHLGSRSELSQDLARNAGNLLGYVIQHYDLRSQSIGVQCPEQCRRLWWSATDTYSTLSNQVNPNRALDDQSRLFR